MLQGSRDRRLFLRKFHRIILETGKSKAHGPSRSRGQGQGTASPVQRHQLDANLSFHQKRGELSLTNNGYFINPKSEVN